MNTLNWDNFRYFVAAVESGSFTGAAKKLNSNQPTVGRQIDALEHTLGIKLFQRSVKGLLLTEEGVAIYERARSMHGSVDQVLRYCQGENKDISGTVRVALPEGLCLEVLTPLLPDFYRAHPYIHLILNVSSNTANLTRGEADIAIRLFRPKESSLVVRHLGPMTMGLYASQNYLQDHGIPSTPAELQQHRIITYGDMLTTLPENQWLLDHAGHRSNILSSDSTLTRFRATLSGVGISIQPNLLCQNHPELYQLLCDCTLPQHEMWIACHHDLRNLSRIRVVMQYISSILTQ